MNNFATTAANASTVATAAPTGGGGNDRLTKATRKQAFALFVAFASLCAMSHSMYYFLFAKLTNRSDQLTVSWIILVSGLTLTVAAIWLCRLKRDGDFPYGLMSYLVAGLLGVIEGTVSLWAIYLEDTRMYMMFNFNGFVLMAGIVVICFMLQLNAWLRSSTS